MKSLAVFLSLYPDTWMIHTFPLASSEVTLAINSLAVRLFGLDLQTLKNQTHIVAESRRSIIAKGRCTFDKMYKIYNSDIINIRPHDLFSSLVPNYNLCLFIRLQKLPLELSVLIKCQLFFKLLYMLINTSLQQVT